MSTYRRESPVVAWTEQAPTRPYSWFGSRLRFRVQLDWNCPRPSLSGTEGSLIYSALGLVRPDAFVSTIDLGFGHNP